MDTFDPKPMLTSTTASRCPRGNLKTERKTGNLLNRRSTFKQYGKSGIEVSEIFPKLGEHVDDLLRHPLDVHGPPESRAVAVHDELRAISSRAVRRWAPG